MRYHLHAGGGCADSCCLEVHGLSVSPGGKPIISDVGFHLHCGEIVALIGPNGAGKTTLLKALLGQREYTGSVKFSTEGRPKQPLIGYVPQTPAFDKTTPVSVMDLFVSCIGSRPVFLPVSRRDRARVTACLERVHADSLIDSPIGSLSGGELQRVLLALALEPLPQVLLLDEPLSGVDVEGLSRLMDMLDELRKSYDLSILLTTHDFSMLSAYADRVLLLDGTITDSGKPADVLSGEAFYRAFGLRLGGERGKNDV